MRGARDRAGVSRRGGGATLASVGRTTFTRRRALMLGAAAGLGSLLAPLRAAPGLAAVGARATRPRGFGLTVTPADFDGGRTSRVLRVRRVDLLGVRGAGDVGGPGRRARGGGGPRGAPPPPRAHAPRPRARGRPAPPGG